MLEPARGHKAGRRVPQPRRRPRPRRRPARPRPSRPRPPPRPLVDLVVDLVVVRGLGPAEALAQAPCPPGEPLEERRTRGLEVLGLVVWLFVRLLVRLFVGSVVRHLAVFGVVRLTTRRQPVGGGRQRAQDPTQETADPLEHGERGRVEAARTRVAVFLVDHGAVLGPRRAELVPFPRLVERFHPDDRHLFLRRGLRRGIEVALRDGLFDERFARGRRRRGSGGRFELLRREARRAERRRARRRRAGGQVA